MNTTNLEVLCLHNRDAGYKEQWHMQWRDSSPDRLVSAALKCTKKSNLKIIRIGQNGRKIKTCWEIDYDKNVTRIS